VTTASALLERVSRQLLSGVVEERNKLATTITSSDTSIVTSYDLNSLRAGMVFEIESELMYIWEASVSSKTLTVERGYAGTTAAAHTAGAVITTNPRFPKSQMFDALNADIEDLSSPVNGLYRVLTLDLTYNGSDRAIDLTGVTNIIDLMDVRLRYLADDYPVIRSIRLQRNLPTTDFPSGNALVFDEPVMAGTLRVTYKAPFTRLTSVSQDIQTNAYIPTSMEDILEMGVLTRMMASREIKRTFIESQGDTRRPEEVPVGSSRDSITNILRLRRDRIIAESSRLKRQNPLKFRL
jgi:hypothetical protein